MKTKYLRKVEEKEWMDAIHAKVLDSRFLQPESSRQSSRQGVGTENASSNFAASHYDL